MESVEYRARWSVFCLVWLICLMATLTAFGATSSPEDVFTQFQCAVSEKDVSTASGLISQGSLAHYDHCLSLSLSAAESELEQLSVGEILTVLQMRSHFASSELRLMDGGSFFASAVAGGLIDLSSLQGFTLRNVRYPALNDAVGILVRDGDNEKKLHVLFQGEQSEWKINIHNLLSVMDPILERMRIQKKVTRTELALELMGTRLGHIAPPSLLKPPMP
ncbi:MAG: hypothetical protein KJ626_13810 [Verrucomicrobia bacterium]|nr:hypothetical protein [Verrucomicrobiota bacterium]